MLNKTIAIILVVFLSSCAQKPQPLDETVNFNEQLQSLSGFNSWLIEGRISIQTEEDAFSASFNWQRELNYQRIEITGLLGQTYALLEVSEEQASLAIQDNEPVVASDLNQLIWSQAGFTIPVELLTDWIKAYPTDSTIESITLNELGMIQSMSYQDWQVSYKNYRRFPQINQLVLPSRTTVTNNRQTIKMAIKSWQPL